MLLTLFHTAFHWCITVQFAHQINFYALARTTKHETSTISYLLRAMSCSSPYTLYLTPYTLHPVPYTLHPVPILSSQSCKSCQGKTIVIFKCLILNSGA